MSGVTEWDSDKAGEAPKHSQLVDVANTVSQMMASKDFGRLRELLRHICSSTADVAVIVTYLRAAYPARTQLIDYDQAVNEARCNFIKRGRNPNTLLMGLDRPAA